MFKKSLSLILCLVMCFSVFSMTVVDTVAAYNVKTIFSVKGENIDGDLLTYTISITKEQKNIGGIILNVDFDSSVLEPVNCAPIERTTTEEGTVKNFVGTYAYGVSESNPDLYVIAYMNDIAVSTTEAKGFFKMQFRVIDDNRPITDVKFYCKEFYSTTETDKNITPADGRQIIAEYLDISTLAKPALKGVEPDVNGLKVSWSAVKGAVGYEIRRCTSTSGWESIGEVGASVTEFVDTGLVSGTTYTYTVRAFNNYGISLYDAVGVSCKYIEKPVISSLRNAVGGVEIKWNATVGADFYLVFRRGVGEAEWTQIAKRNVNSGTTYKDTTVIDGDSYEYDIAASTDIYTTPNADEAEEITYIASPSVSGVTNTLAGIEVKWTAHPQATHYIIYRRDRALEAQLIEYSVATGTSFIDTNVTPGRIYIYSVKACTNIGESAYSVTGYTITRVAPTEVTSLTLEKSGVKVQWAPVNGVTGYNIYRKNISENTWTKAGVVDGNTTTFSDTGLKSGTEYRYAVCPTLSTSEGAKIESAPIYYIEAPEGVTGENIVEGIKVTWEPSDGAIKYIVMRSDIYSSDVKIAEIDANETLEYIDTNVFWNESYSYTVKAISLKGNSLMSDSSAGVLRIGAMGIATPELYEGGIRVTWEAVSTADAYAVFRNDGSGWVQVNEVTDTEYIDTNVSSTKTYAYAVGAIIDESRGIVLTDNAPGLKYIAPTSSIVATNGSNYSKITWQAVEGAVTYEVYRASSDDFSELVLLTTVGADELSYVDRGVEAGKTYYYTIRTNDGEKSSVYSTPLEHTFLTIPQIKSIANAYDGITFSWGAVEGAQKYHVYRKIYGATYYTYITTVDADTLSFTDTGATNGKIMCYTVKAVNGDSSSAYLARCMTYVEAPKIAFSNSASGVFLKWDKNDSAAGYWVYRKAGNAKYWTRIAVVTTPYYTDKNVTSGTNYTYTVKTYSGKILSACNMDGWTIKHLSVPQLVSAANGYGAITATWKKVPGAAAYYVYRKEDGAASWTYIGKTTALTFRDTNVKNKSTYTYTVRAYYGSDISYFNTTGVSVKHLTAPTVSVANRTGNVTLSWNAISGASSYYVYRKAGNATTWTRIATVTKPGYIDKNVSNKTTYTYTVRAYGSKTLSGCNLYGWKTTYLDTPDMLSATSTTSGITFKWAPVKGCTSYSVFRKEGNGAWKQIGTVGSNVTSYTDKNVEMGVKYTYTVRAKYGNYLSWFESNLTCTHKY